MLLRVAVLFSLAFCRMILLMIAAMGL